MGRLFLKFRWFSDLATCVAWWWNGEGVEGVGPTIELQLQRRLQSVLNAAAWLIYHMRSADHITDALISLHWLRASQRIEYKVAVLT